MGAWEDYLARLSEDLAAGTGNKYLEYLGTVREPDLSSTILVGIPVYDDPEFIPTMESARAAAANPDRIRFAVCYQDDVPEELAFLESFPGTRFVHVHREDAKGLCVARAMCQDLLEDEDFVMHVDSHMRFAPGWDVALLAQWSACGGGKAIISEYPKPYPKEQAGVYDLQWALDNAGTGGMYVVPGYFSGGTARLRQVPGPHRNGTAPARGMFLAGGFLLAPASFDRDIPWDRNMDFLGDEMPAALRAWTHGYDVWHPGARCVFHLYTRIKKVLPDGTIEARDSRQGVVGEDGVSARDRETRRMAVLCGLEGDAASLGRYGPGAARTVESFFRQAGVDMRKLVIAQFAHDGKFWEAEDGQDRRPWDWLAEGRLRNRPCGRQEEFRHRLTDRTLGMLRECAGELGILPEQALALAMREWAEGTLAAGPR